MISKYSKKLKSIKRQNKKVLNISSRGVTIYIFFLLGLIGLFGRVVYIRAEHGEEYAAKSLLQQTNHNDNIIKPNRGAIFDRNGQKMAFSSIVYNVILDANLLMIEEDDEKRNKKITATVDLLTSTFGKTQEDIMKLLEKNESGDYSKYYRVEKKVSGNVKTAMDEVIKENNIKGVIWFEKDSKRIYPQNSLASGIIGFMSGDNGTYGIEEKYNEYLKGIPGRTFVTYNQGNSSQNKPPQDGDTISLTIDAGIQGFVETAIVNAVEQTKPRVASAIVMDPNTGEILAMASSPGFDLNSPRDEKSLGANVVSMTEEEKSNAFFNLWRNYNISDTYEPGSTFKPMVVAAALEESLSYTQDTFTCTGSMQLIESEDPIKCWKYPSSHGVQTLDKALANSCNPAMMQIGARMGRDTFYKYQRAFGFGEKTGVDLPAEESSINLLHPLEGINKVELATMSFGQGFNCTPLQLLNAFCAVINGGNLMKPYIVSQIVDSENVVVMQNSPTVERKVISKETSDTMKRYLQEVVEVGTGTKVKINGYTVGGKTGTAQQGIRKNEEYVVSFVGFVPADNPQIIAMALLDRPEKKDKATADVMLKEILENIIVYKGIQSSTSIIDSELAEKSVTLDDYSVMTTMEATSNINMQGLEVKTLGVGSIIINQMPKPGETVEKGTEIILYLGKAESGDTVKTPDLIGKNYDDAIANLNELGIIPVMEGDREGVVVEQEPKKDIVIDVGGSVRIKFQK